MKNTPSNRERFRIDINDRSVYVVKTNAAGKIVKAASAAVPPLPETSDLTEYTVGLTQAIKKASRSAGFTRIGKKYCVVVTGGQHVVVRHFSWPDMPSEALAENVRTEIEPFLPENTTGYTIGLEVSNQKKSEETAVTIVDIIAAAIPTNIARAINDAVSKAGYIPVRLDIYENALGKLIKYCSSIEEESYAVLNISESRVSLSLYLGGVFYSNRYFVAGPLPDPGDDPDAIMAALSYTPLTGYDEDTLVSEITSILDYIHYRERGAHVKCIFLKGDGLENINQKLAANLDIPVYSQTEWLKTVGIPKRPRKKQKSDKIDLYLEAYGAGLPAITQKKMDLRPPKIISPIKQAVLPLILVLLLLVVPVTLGIYFPNRIIANLEAEEARLQSQLASYQISEAEVALLSARVNAASDKIENIDRFVNEMPQALVVLPVIVRDSGLTPVLISSGGGNVTVSGESSNFNRLADSFDRLRSSVLFRDASMQQATHNYTTFFHIILEKQREAGGQ